MNGQKENVDSLKKQGLSSLQRNQPLEARHLFTQICDDNPNDADAWYWLCVTNGMLGDLPAAGDCCRRSISLQPSHGNAHAALGNILSQDGRHREAFDHYQMALRINPDNAATHNNYGNALKNACRQTDAIESYRRAIAAKPDYALAHYNLGVALMGTREQEKAVDCFRRVVSLNPNHAEAYNNLGVLLKSMGRLDEAKNALHQAVTIRPDYAEAYNNLGNVFRELGHFDHAKNSYKHAITSNPKRTHRLIDTIIDAAFDDGLIKDVQNHFTEERGDKRLIVVAAAPKSGSTFLANSLCNLTGANYFRLCSAYSTNEQDLYLPALCIANPYGCVSQLHIKGSFHNAALMRAFDIKPIILVRQIYDTVISLKNDLRKKQESPEFATGKNGFSFIWQDESLKNLNNDQLIDAIIDLAVPWYVNFYVSWQNLCAQGAVDAIWITYEQMMTEKESTLTTISSFLGFRDIGKIDDVILSKKYSTFSKGNTGEGIKQLTSTQIERIKEHFKYYPDIDFSKFGV
jgi:tetratricopeptide (TPR) repeat protein